MDSKEAQFFARSLQGRVSPDQLHSLDVGCAIARIGKEIVRVETPINKPIPERHFREEIIAQSRRKYYKPVNEIRNLIRNRYQSAAPIKRSAVDTVKKGGRKKTYDEILR